MIVTNPEIVCDLDRLWSALLRIQVQPSSIFESLPQRIIYFIFDNLDYDDLVVCKEVCKSFHRIINGIPSLLYRIELAAAGMQDVPQVCLSPAKKLEVLRRYQRASCNPSWTSFSRLLLVPFGLDDWKLPSGILAQANDGWEISFTKLGSSILEVPEARWTLQFNQEFTSYSVEPSQDLLILVCEDSHGNQVLELFSLKTGLPHPKTAHNTIQLLVPDDDQNTALEIRVYGDKLACLCTWVVSGWSGSIFTVWNWHTGDVILSNDTSGHCYLQEFYADKIFPNYTNFVFLDAHCIALSVVLSNDEHANHTALIEVVDITEASNAFATSMAFFFPSISCDTDIVTFTLSCHTPLDDLSNSACIAPFVAAREQSVLAVKLELRHHPLEHNDLLAFFVPVGRLLDEYHEAFSEDSDARLQLWEEWGPQSSRLLHDLTEEEMQWSTFGSRLVFRDDGHVVLADFNPVSALANAAFPASMCHEDDGIVIHEESEYQTPSLVMDCITTLPYRLYFTKLKVDGDCKTVHLSENTLLINDNDEGLHLMLTV